MSKMGISSSLEPKVGRITTPLLLTTQNHHPDLGEWFQPTPFSSAVMPNVCVNHSDKTPGWFGLGISLDDVSFRYPIPFKLLSR